MFHVEHSDLPDSDNILDICRELRVEPPEDFPYRLGTFLDLLNSCSSRMNLIGPEEWGRIWRRHVLESVCYASRLESGPVVDVGTGAGFPGLILALLGYTVTMVEPREKRCGFLSTAARECGIKADVLCSRIEDTGPYGSGSRFTARAVRKPEELVKLLGIAAAGDFSLLVRVPATSCISGGDCVFHRLPVPPLDREGFLLQYSHSDNKE